VLSDHHADYGGANIDFAFTQKAIQRHWLWIVGISLFMALLATLFSWACFQESYQSSARILLDLSDKSAGPEFNPYKNQEELLKSELVLNRVAQSIQAEKMNLRSLKAGHFFETVFRAERIPGTGFITLSAKADKPDVAKKLALIYMESYWAVTNELFKKTNKQSEKVATRQSHYAEATWDAFTEKVTASQGLSKDFGVMIENQGKAQQLGNLDSQIKITQADLAQKQAEANRIRQQLKVGKSSLESMIQAVAKGQDTTLNTLQEKLHDLQTDYNTKALVYAPTNPDMIQLQHQMETLKSKITDQQILTTGDVSQPHPTTGYIKDSVRVGLISRLAMVDAELTALRSRLGTLRAQYHQIQKPVSHTPVHSAQTISLIAEQKKPENVKHSHSPKVIEDHKHQSAVSPQNFMVIAPPDLPQKPTGLLRWQIILLAALSGFILSSVAIVGYAVSSQPKLRSEFIEQVLDLPILGSIPWLTDKKWRYLRSCSSLALTAIDVNPAMLQAYQDLAFNLKVRRNALQKNALVFSQILNEKGHAVILSNLGLCLAQGGDRVLLIDADFRNPGLHETFNHSLDYERGLPELINGVSELLYRKKDVQVQDVLKLVNATVTPSGLHPQLEYLNAGLEMNNTFEFLNSKSFDVLLKVLKTDYDWVLISAPPVLKAPDSSILAGYVDGLLLLTDPETEASHMVLVAQKIQRMGSTAYGVILRGFSVE
jgi:Mrp family chromosome partitioning ATPase/uncharacterized protein involved in exopolysaccharide biosynthesis